MNTQTPLFFGVIACVLEKTMDGLRLAINKAFMSTSIEIRLDSLYAANSPQDMRKILLELPKLIGTKLTILTLRSEEQGGVIRISHKDQLKFWLGLPEPLFKLIFSKDSNVYVDWDLNFVKYVMETVNKPVFLWEKVGCSLHFLDRTPDRLPAFLHTMQQTSAQAFFKIVTKATQPEDSQKIWNLFHKRNGDSRPLIAFAMGEIGMESRFKCLSFGSAGTYGYIDGRQSAAPGQVPFHQLMADLRIRDYLR